MNNDKYNINKYLKEWARVYLNGQCEISIFPKL